MSEVTRTRRKPSSLRVASIFCAVLLVCLSYRVYGPGTLLRPDGGAWTTAGPSIQVPADDPRSPRQHVLANSVRNVRALDSGKIEVQLEIDIDDLVNVIEQTNGHASQAIVEQLPLPVSYNINTQDVCTRREGVELIIYLHSAPKNSLRRTIVRMTWGNTKLFKNGFTKIIFLIGLPRFDDPDREHLQELITKEHLENRDIVQGNFQDDYRNLTLKGIMGLHWVTNFCPMAKFALKSDDDVFINIFKIREILMEIDKPEDTLACISYKEKTMPILRFPKNCLKWCIQYRELAGRKFYPEYCAGLAFMISQSLVAKMYQQSLITPFFWVDDAYVTGLLTVNLTGIRRVPLNKYMSLFGRDAQVQYSSKTEPLTYIFIHGIMGKDMYDMWNNLLGKISPDERILLEENFQVQSKKLYDKRIGTVVNID